MIRNYFTIAIRNLLKHRGYALLNLMGLSVGLACFAQIGLWVQNELNYDQFHSNADRIYRVAGIFTSESDHMQQAVTPTPLSQALKDEFPEVEESLRLDKNDAIIQRGDSEFMEDDLILTDPSFFDMFDFKMLSGNPATALNNPYSIVLSKALATKYFGNENPIGQSLKIFLMDPDGKGIDYTVTGVLENCPENSHFQYSALISFKTFEVNNGVSPHDWFNNGYYTYVQLAPGATQQDLEAKLPQLIEKYMGAQNREWKINYEYFLQPLRDIHLYSHLKYEIEETRSLSNVIIFGSIGCIVLLLACINYINLATAFSTRRVKEVGVRKVMGAFKKQLVSQYITESWLLVVLSLFLAFVWIELTRPLFESLTGAPIIGLYEPFSLAVLILIATLVGILAGSYPALLLSSLRPVNIMKGYSGGSDHGAFLRKSLVVLQYTITIVLVAGILVVRGQLNFMRQQELGFNQAGLAILNVNGSNEVITGYEGFVNDLRALPQVDGVARSNSTLAGGLSNSVAEYDDASGKHVNGTVYRVFVDHDYLDVYEMQLLAGRFFNKGNAADSTRAFIVNESMVRSAGFNTADEMIGNGFTFQGVEGEVIGVVKDFHYNSLKYAVDPTCMRLLRRGFSKISVRMSSASVASMDEIEQLWKKHFPTTLFSFRFAEESLNDQYQAEQRFEKIFLVFSILSLSIACLGLYALVSFSIEGRVKEIGIRKVLGASLFNIQSLVSREFLALILLSAVISLPLIYYFMNQWLEGFRYRISLSPVVFLVAFMIVFTIALLTISAKSLKAAASNPINSLRNE